ncbi:hypothetical protein [Aminobacter sp. AP02]|nr:hypothetical protein [Aminobacter sp. AP02]PWK72650.1 hypothetical protein C8K44_10591 [Aminobacter sp. AP02]
MKAARAKARYVAVAAREIHLKNLPIGLPGKGTFQPVMGKKKVKLA